MCKARPSVKYRGIFLNDEAPDLSNWILEKFGTVATGTNPPVPPGVANYNRQFYTNLFELILRLKGNYLWPAMWNNAFNEDDPENPGWRMNTASSWAPRIRSRCLRAQKEWDRRYQNAGQLELRQTPGCRRKFLARGHPAEQEF